MARVTVEDCIEKVANRFDLVLVASHRARMIAGGAEITIPKDNDKDPVVALREIADSQVTPEDLREELIHSLQKHVEVDEPEDDAAPSVEPLDTNIFGDNVDQIEEDSERMSEEELLRGMEKAIAENSRLEVMIDNILNASRIENKMLKVHFEHFDLIMFLNVIAEKFNKIHQKEVIKTDFLGKIEIKADKFMIEMCVNNLIENALKYGDSNKPIVLYCKLTEKKQVKFGVKDEGNGVPLSFRKELFNKFARNENEETRLQKGTGLGLFITSEFIKIHKGKIKYNDNVPKGANFEITLKL